MKTQFFISVLALTLAAPTLLNAQADKAASVVQAYFAAVDAGDVDQVETLCSADFIASAPFAPQPMPISAWKGVGLGFKTAFPDMRHEIIDWVSDGQKIAVRGMFRGTNSGSMQGNPPTGNKVATPFNTYFTLNKDLKITAVYVQFDQLAFQQQVMAGIDPNARAAALVRDYFAAVDAADTAKIASFCAPNLAQYFPGDPVPQGLSVMQMRVLAFKSAFPDIKRQIKEIAVAGNCVTVRGLLTGTNTGAFMGKPATGKPISIPVLALYRLNAEGLIVEAFVEFDSKTLDQQLGNPATAGK